MTRRTLSVLLALCMLLGLLPFGAFAAQEDFSDVPADAWYAADVAYAAEHGLMNGVGGGKFDPDGTTTRAMLVTILHRLEGTPAAARSAFTDVPAGEWYTAAVDWAAANKIVEGMDAKTFAPEENITREQFAVILYRYANFKGMDTAEKAALGAFADAGSVSPWAADAMAWANAAGLINGVSKTELQPQGSAVRAQAAAILGRFDRMVKAGEAKPGTVTLKVNKTEATVTEPRQTFTGAYTVENDQIDRIDWVQHSDGEAYEGTTGTAMIDQTKGTWEAADLLLAPGANTLVFTAYTKNGASAEQTVEITYDSGEVADYTNSDITYIDDNGTGFVNDVLLVFVDADCSDNDCEEAMKALCEAVQGEIIGQLNAARFYQVRVAHSNYEDLQALCERAKAASNLILSVTIDKVHPANEAPRISGEMLESPAREKDGALPLNIRITEPATINDTWDNSGWPETVPNEWNEDDPQGSNWWAEAIRARYAWAYSDYFNYAVPVGIADTGIDKTNPDLDGLNITTLSANNVRRAHGTHVAGLIGAEQNNNTGMTGMTWTKTMYNYDLNPNGNGFYDSDVITAVTTLVQTGKCKIINNSNGAIVQTPANLSASSRNNASQTFTSLINNNLKNYDFLVFQAAGNGYDENGYQSAPTVNPSTGEITNNDDWKKANLKYAFHDYGFDAAYNEMFAAITDASAKKHVVVVAAAQQIIYNEEGSHKQEYQLTPWSCYGTQVDVAAPGLFIYSTYYQSGTNDQFMDMSGTSMATPITAGLAAMVWSVNPEFTAAQVKEMICSDASTIPCYRNNQNETTQNASGYYYANYNSYRGKYESAYVSGSYSFGLDERETYRMINAQAAVEEALERTYGDGTLNVSFVNSANNQPVNNVSYEIRLGSPDGDVVTSGTANGSASITLPRAQGTDYHQAQYYLVATGNFTDYTSSAFKIDVGGTTSLIAALNVPEAPQAQSFRIVLTWNAEPADLDAHLFTDQGGHIYYKQHSIDYARMDLDDTQSFGPETITVDDVSALGGFTYAVHNFTDRAQFSDASRLASSGAVVRVYSGSELLKTYTVPENMYGTVWNVFSVDENGVITDGGDFSYSGNGEAIPGLFTDSAAPQSAAWLTVAPKKQ